MHHKYLIGLIPSILGGTLILLPLGSALLALQSFVLHRLLCRGSQSRQRNRSIHHPNNNMMLLHLDWTGEGIPYLGDSLLGLHLWLGWCRFLQVRESSVNTIPSWSCEAVVPNPGPQGPPVLHVFDVSLLQHT